jgi:hypothetical protein
LETWIEKKPNGHGLMPKKMTQHIAVPLHADTVTSSLYAVPGMLYSLFYH